MNNDHSISSRVPRRIVDDEDEVLQFDCGCKTRYLVHNLPRSNCGELLTPFSTLENY